MVKEEVLRLRISLEDKQIIQSKADEYGLKVSAYARQMLLFGKVIKVDPQD